MNNNQPLLMTYLELRKTLIPFCKGKKALIDGINDIWKSAIPQPNTTYHGKIVKMILPSQFKEFTQLCLKENG